MNTKRGSKNEISNREERTVKICSKCNNEQKGIMVINRKRKMVFECDCGVFFRNGVKLTTE